MLFKRYMVMWDTEMEPMYFIRFFTRRGAFNFAFEEVKTTLAPYVEVMKYNRKSGIFEHVQKIFSTQCTIKEGKP
jgi:hypothetical protein